MKQGWRDDMSPEGRTASRIGGGLVTGKQESVYLPKENQIVAGLFRNSSPTAPVLGWPSEESHTGSIDRMHRDISARLRQDFMLGLRKRGAVLESVRGSPSFEGKLHDLAC